MKQTVRSKWLTLSVFVAFVVVSVFGFVWIYTGTHAASSSAPLKYIQYADPYGFYTVDLPSTWRAQYFSHEQVLNGANGDSMGESMFFRNANNSGMVIFVNVNASATREKLHCPIPAQNATVAGIPATYLPIIENGRDTYIFATMAAGYQLSYRATLYGRSETATGSDQAIYTRFITSFKPIPATPFHC